MKHKSRTLGWLAVVAAGVWLFYDYQHQIGKAITAGWVTIALTAAHIFTAKR